MALTRSDCMAAASALVFLGLLGGESALVLGQRGFASNPTAYCDSWGGPWGNPSGTLSGGPSVAFTRNGAGGASMPCGAVITARAEALGVDATRAPHRVRRDENPFIDSGEHEAYLAGAYAALQARVAAEQEAPPPQTDTDLENR